MTTPHPGAPPSDEWDHISAVPPHDRFVRRRLPRPRRFAHLTRTVNPDGTHTLDAIDQDGRAWWLILGNDEAPETWTELQPLPSYEDQP